MHHLHQFSQKLVVLVLLSLLVSGEKQEEKMEVGIINSTSKQQSGPNMDKHEKQSEKRQQQRLRHSFDAFVSSERKVPNASDPLHNR